MRKMKVWLSGILFVFLFFICSGNAIAVNQQIELMAGWNLISFAVQPTNSEVKAVLDEIITNGKFIAIWTHDAESETWSTYPAPLDAIP
ncbi:MAG: hypothetical protein KAR13_14070, partial [Desulfobulbaceae bacterium]|nr:hypothetical protein [Desulfobulbaceae bacterium]